MFENMFTTKMSTDKKSLQQRFLKIRSESSRLSKLAAIVIFSLVIAAIMASAIYVAVRKSNENEYGIPEEKEQIIKSALGEGNSIIQDSGLHWHVNAAEVREIFNILSSRINMKYQDIKNDSYDVFVYNIQSGEDTFYSLFVIDNTSGEMLFNLSGLSIDNGIFREVISYLDKNRPYMNNAEKLTYQELEILQKEADNGHYPWRLDPVQVIKQYMSEIGIEDGGIKTLAGGVTISADYVTGDDTYYRIELFRPIRTEEDGILIVKDCYETGEEINKTAIAVKNGKIYKDLKDKSSEIADIRKNDLVCVIYEKDGGYYVQMPLLSFPSTVGFVKKDVVSFDADFGNASYGAVEGGTAVYNTPNEDDVYSYEQEGTVTIHKRENGYCLVSFPGGVDNKWVKEEDIQYRVIRSQ